MDYCHTYLRTRRGLVIGAYFPKNLKDMNEEVAIVFAQGALSSGDSGKSTIHEASFQFGIPVFIPDYYGHFRSNGNFSPTNCAKTILDTINICLGKEKIYDVNLDKERKIKFKNALVIGSSFGGWIPWYINKFFQTNFLDRFGLIAPLIDFQNQGKVEKIKEESMENFLRKGRKIYRNAYRGLEEPIWDVLLSGKDENLNPLENISYISKSSISIVHGMSDQVINHNKSVNLYKELTKINPKNKFLDLLPGIQHTSDSLNVKVSIILEKLLTKNEKRLPK